MLNTVLGQQVVLSNVGRHAKETQVYLIPFHLDNLA